MNPLIKKVLGEADTASETERQVLDQEIQAGPATDHGEADMGNPEESSEVNLARQIITACKAGDQETVCKAAQQIIDMHQPAAAGPHTQPVGVAGLGRGT